MKNNFKLILLCSLLCLTTFVNAQVGINATGASPNSDAMLDVSSTTKGLLLPRVSLTSTSSASPLSTHVIGMVVYNIANASDVTSGYYYNDGLKWVRLASSSSGWSLTGNAGTVAGTNFIGTTDNVDLVFKRNSMIAGLVSSNNIAFGEGALYNMTGLNNTAIGNTSLASLTTGQRNTALGTSSMYSATVGSENTAIGFCALQAITAISSNNVAIGSSAGRYYGGALNQNNTGSSSSVFLGAFTYPSAIGNTNEIVIGYNATGAGSNSITLGNTSVSKIKLRSVVYTLPAAQATAAGQTLTNDGTGVLSWAAANSGWGLTGNAGTTAGTNFMGTTDDVDVVFKRNNTQAGWLSNTTLQNTAFGVEALPMTSTGEVNTAFGYLSLSANTSGYANSAFGTEALSSNTTGFYNVAVGSGALLENIGGSGNNAFGVEALRFNISGTGNTALGGAALGDIIDGNDNTAIGTAAGTEYSNNEHSLQCVYVGANTGSLVGNHTNEIAIGYGAQGAGDNSITLGNADVSKIKLRDVVYTLPATQATAAGQTLTNDGTGVLTWAAGGSGWGLTGNAGTTAGTNFIGTTDDVDVVFKRNNTQAGWLSNTTLQNTAFGVEALPMSTTTGDFNTAFGFEALKSNTTGRWNNAFGDGALYSNTIGVDNAAFGNATLFSNTSGEANVAFGESTLTYNTTGNYNTGLGYGALMDNIDGNNNVGIGLLAGAGNNWACVHSNKSIFIGFKSEPSAENNTNEIVIGSEAMGAGSNSITLGNASVSKIKLRDVVYTLPAAQATAAGQMLTNDGTGALSWGSEIKATRYLSTAPAAIVGAGTTTVNLATGNVFTITLAGSVTVGTFSFTNAPTSPETFVIKISYSGTGNAITWPAAFKWSGGTAPTLTNVSGKVDIVSVIYDGAGGYYCSYALNF